MALFVICFLDNDILLKLSAFDLLDEIIAALHIDSENLRVLDTARFVFSSNRMVTRKYSQSVRDRAIQFVNNCQPVIVSDCDEFDVLTQLLDVGEATLVMATLDSDSFILMTGDKRCLQTVATRPEIADAYERLQGRVICLEQVLLRLIRSVGFEVVKARVIVAWDCDTAIKACFGSGMAATEAQVVDALDGYIEALRQDAPGLLADLSGSEGLNFRA